MVSFLHQDNVENKNASMCKCEWRKGALELIVIHINKDELMFNKHTLSI